MARAEKREMSYRKPLVVTDVISASVATVGMIAFVENGSPPTLVLASAGASGYMFGGPIVHAKNGNWRGAGTSVLLRLAPVAIAGGVALGYKFSGTCDENPDCASVSTPIVTFAVTAPIALVMDWAFLPIVQVDDDHAVVAFAGTW
jgi:hypothetical protein